jgi:1-acyl-sn-glycerol-3-phosphate acyltransferase
MADPVYRPIVWGFKGIFSALGIRFDIVGVENVPAVGGAVIAINHTSYLDFALSGIPADRQGKRLVRFMAKDSVFRHRVSGPLMRGMKHIPVNRSAGSEAFNEAVRVLRNGELVGVFPEATMSRSMDIKPIKAGAVRMAQEAGVPIVPMCVLGGARLYSYGHRDLSRGRTIAMTVGEAIEVAPDADVQERTAELSRRMRALLDETVARYPRGAPDDERGEWWIPARLGGTAPTPEEVGEAGRS